MISLPSALIAAAASFGLSFGSQMLEEQRVLKHAQNHDTLSGKEAVGVGFDLTASYGIAAVSYANGTTLPIARINGHPEYHELLSRLSHAWSTHPAPPYSNIDEMLRDKPRQAKRMARKNAGLPASGDVAVLGTMLASLREAVESHLGHSVYSAAATMPHLVALYLEDIHDAFEYLDLQYLDMPVRYGRLHETSTAYAGYGFGLCSRYTDLPTCKAQQQAMPDDVVMAVLYTASALTVTLSVMKSAYYLWEPSYRHIEDFDLGSDAKHDNPDETYYWERVRDRLREIIILHQYYERPSKVLLLGESAHEKQFQRILNEALKGVMDTLPEMYQADAERVAAVGAAEMAKRAPWDPYKFASDLCTRDAFEILNERRDEIGR